MTQDEHGFDMWGVATAIAGLRGAQKRFLYAHREPIPFHDEAAVAVVDFVNSACSVDELLGGLAKTSYATRRDGDGDGCVIPRFGLCGTGTCIRQPWRRG